jgi:predicted GNAT family acetyltransferase
MPLIAIHNDNIDREHICCAISDKKGENCVASKKAWMKNCFANGLVFLRLDERAKVLIEYIPVRNAWLPIEADNFMHINCFWVSGQYKGKGYANQLLEACIADAKKKGMSGLTILSSPKKMSFLSDPRYLKYKGFRVADTAKPHFELLYLPFFADTSLPKFKSCAKEGVTDDTGMVLYYSNQCPHTDKYAPMLDQLARQRGSTVKLIKLETAEQAQNAPSPFTTYSFFYQGKFVTNEILSEKKFHQFLEGAGI